MQEVFLPTNLESPKYKHAKYSNKLSVESNTYTNSTLCIGISNPKTSSSTTIKPSGLLTSASPTPTANSKDWKQPVDRHATQHLKWSKGKISTRLSWLISGAVGSSSMPCSAAAYPSKILKPPNFIRKYSQESTKYPNTFPRMRRTSWAKYWTPTRRKDSGLKISGSINGGHWAPPKRATLMASLWGTIEYPSMTQSWMQWWCWASIETFPENALRLIGIMKWQPPTIFCWRSMWRMEAYPRPISTASISTQHWLNLWRRRSWG